MLTYQISIIRHKGVVFEEVHGFIATVLLGKVLEAVLRQLGKNRMPYFIKTVVLKTLAVFFFFDIFNAPQFRRSSSCAPT